MSATAPDGSRQASLIVSPSTVFSSRLVVQGTLATVGMPSRSYTSARFES